jgi:hypothetical protein
MNFAQRSTSGYSNGSKQIDSLALPRGLWKPHDFRCTGATLMTALGVPLKLLSIASIIQKKTVSSVSISYTYETEMK